MRPFCLLTRDGEVGVNKELFVKNCTTVRDALGDTCDIDRFPLAQFGAAEVTQLGHFLAHGSPGPLAARGSRWAPLFRLATFLGCDRAVEKLEEDAARVCARGGEEATEFWKK